MDTTRIIWLPQPLTAVAVALSAPASEPIVDVWSGNPDTDKAWR